LDCEGCGLAFDDSATVCGSCGHLQSWAAPAAPATPSAPATFSLPESEWGSAPAQPLTGPLGEPTQEPPWTPQPEWTQPQIMATEFDAGVQPPSAKPRRSIVAFGIAAAAILVAGTVGILAGIRHNGGLPQTMSAAGFGQLISHADLTPVQSTATFSLQMGSLVTISETGTVQSDPAHHEGQ
jgi:hypothetical protein